MLICFLVFAAVAKERGGMGVPAMNVHTRDARAKLRGALRREELGATLTLGCSAYPLRSKRWERDTRLLEQAHWPQGCGREVHRKSLLARL